MIPVQTNHYANFLFRHFGDTFKWLFYGDDDSVLFLQGAMKIVAGLDPDLPYALTGMPVDLPPAWENF